MNNIFKNFLIALMVLSIFIATPIMSNAATDQPEKVGDVVTDAGTLTGQWEGSINDKNGNEYKYNFDFYEDKEVVITRQTPSGIDKEILNYSIFQSADIFNGSIKISVKISSDGSVEGGKIGEFENLMIDKQGNDGYVLMFDNNAPNKSLQGKQMSLKKVSSKHMSDIEKEKEWWNNFLNSIWFYVALCGVVLVVGIAIILVLRRRAKKKAN